MKIRLTLIFLLIMNFAMFGENINELFNRANRRYQSKEYDKAIELYNHIYSKGYVSAELFYNMGNAYFRLNKLGYAILFYEKANKISLNDEDIQFNLKFAKAKTVDKLDEVPTIFLTLWWNSIISIFTYSGWAIVIIITWILFLISLGLYFLSRKLLYKKYGFYFSSILFALLLFFAVIFYSSYSQETNTNYGILTDEMTIVKQAPDSQSSDAFIIHQGIKFSFEDRVNNWTKIKLTDGKVGWIENSTFQKI
ncbi:MAG: tetratricopeptide repeat protein [Ignavibacteriales bacterium]